MSAIAARQVWGRASRPGAARAWHFANLLALPAIAVLWVSWVTLDYRMDAYGFWLADLDNLYAIPWGTSWASPYSPAFHLLIEPFGWFGWHAFYGTWMVAVIGAACWLVSPVVTLGLLLLNTPLRHDVVSGNIHTLLALSAVVSFRYPAAWAWPLLTKVTPGIGVAWYAVRREWRSFGIALGATAVALLVGAVLLPSATVEWFGLLAANRDSVPVDAGPLVTTPLLYRLLVALLLVGVGAWRGWRWLVPVAMFVALPAVWFSGLCLLLAMPRLYVADVLHDGHRVGGAVGGDSDLADVQTRRGASHA